MSQTNDELIFDEEFGDLLADVNKKPEPKVVQPEVKKAEEVVEPKETTASSSDEGFIPFGQKTSSIPIPRFKATKESKARIAIISKNVLSIKTHYVDGLGTIICLDGKCCELEGLPRVRYIIPVVQYEVNKSGAIISNSIELKGLSLGAEQYDALADAINFSGRDVRDVDIIVTCSDEQYQKLTFAADASSGASWKTFPDAKLIAEKFKQNKDKLYMSVARKVSAEAYLTKKGFMSSSSQPVGSVSSFEDLGLD